MQPGFFLLLLVKLEQRDTLREEVSSEKETGLDFGNSQPAQKILNLKNSLPGKCALEKKQMVRLNNLLLIPEKDKKIVNI